MAMIDAAEDVALETLELLESRLRQVEYAITGDQVHDERPSSSGDDATQTVAARIQRLGTILSSLNASSRVAHDLLELRSRHPDLFHSLSDQEIPTTLSTSELLAMILASAPSYHATVSRLNSLKDLPVPPAEASASLVALQPRIDAIDAKQRKQEEELSQLRARSAALLERWYALSVLGSGEQWTQWEARLMRIEQAIRREELAQEREKNEV